MWMLPVANAGLIFHQQAFFVLAIHKQGLEDVACDQHTQRTPGAMITGTCMKSVRFIRIRMSSTESENAQDSISTVSVVPLGSAAGS